MKKKALSLLLTLSMLLSLVPAFGTSAAATPAEPVFDDRFGGAVTTGNYNTVYTKDAVPMNDCHAKTEGYTFAGWSTAIDDESKIINPTPENGKTYYAVWKNAADNVVVTTPLDFNDGTEKTGYDANGITWVKTTNTLTLNGATVDVTDSSHASLLYGIIVPADAKIIVKADSAVSVSNAATKNRDALGIRSYGNLTIKGESGTLGANDTAAKLSIKTSNGAAIGSAITAGGTVSLNDGIWTQGNLIFGVDDTKDIDVTVTAGERAVSVWESKDFTLHSGKLTVNGTDYGLFVTKDVLLEGGTLVSNDSRNGIMASGTYTQETGTSVTVSSTDVGLKANGITIEGGTANVTVSKLDEGTCPIESTTGNITISDGSVTTNGGCEGIKASAGTLTISNGTVDSTARITALWGNTAIDISGGTVEAKANNVGTYGNTAKAIYCYTGDINISDTANVTATGTSTSTTPADKAGVSYGIRTKAGNVTITGNDAVVTASGSTAAYSVSGTFTATNAVIKTGADEANAAAQTGDAKAAVTGAKYASVSFAPTFDDRFGGTVTQDNCTTVYTNSTNPYKSTKGYDFAGWYTSEDYSGSPVTSDFVNGTTYYAKWTKGSQTVITQPITKTETNVALSGETYDLLSNEGGLTALTLAAGTTLTLQEDSITTILVKSTAASGDAYGIDCLGELTVTGAGTLKIDCRSSNGAAVGIASNAAPITVSGGATVEIITDNGTSIYTTGDIILDNATVTAKAETLKDGRAVCGIYSDGGNISIKNGADISVTLPENSAMTDKNNYGIAAVKGNITIEGENTKVKTSGGDIGIIAYHNSSNIGTLSISGGTVTVDSGTQGLWTKVAMNISGGTVNATAHGYVEGATGKAAKAIYSQGTINISEDADVTAICINDKDVTAEGAKFYAIRAKDNITVSGDSAIVVAKGDTAAFNLEIGKNLTAVDFTVTGNESTDNTGTAVTMMQDGDGKVTAGLAAAKYVKIEPAPRICKIGDTGYTSIAKALSVAGTNATTIKLIANHAENVTIANTQNITLDLNGYVLSADTADRVITNNGTLYITDSDTTAQTHKTHKFSVDATTGLWTLDETNGTETVTGGQPGGGKNGGAILNNEGAFASLTNINIVGNKLTDAASGGGVYNDGTMSMTSCLVAGNVSGDDRGTGGGIENAGESTLTLTDCTIAGNVSYDTGSGIMNCGTATLTGCTVTGNVSTEKFGAVYSGSLSLTLDGNTSITGNKQADGTASNLVVIVADDGEGGTVSTAVKLGDSFSSSSKIGVTMLDESTETPTGGKFTTNGTSTDEQYFTSDVSTYKVKFDTNHLALAVKTTSSGSSSTITVPVSGDKTSVKVQATVSGTNATVKNVTSEEITKVGTGADVVIDLTSLNKSVTGVTIPKTTMENVVASAAKGLEVKLPGGTVAVFDKTTLSAVAEQAKGANIQLVVDRDSKAEQTLNTAQKETIKDLNNPVVLDAYFVSNGARISDFKGGEAKITATYPTTNPVRVWYVADNGTKTLVPSIYDGKTATFTVTHFSHYVVEQLDGSSYAACPQDATCVYAKFTDAKTTEWYHDGVHFCVENGYMNGVDGGLFAPNDTLSRAMIVTMLWRMESSPVANYAMTFTDVAADQWYTEAIRWAQSTGVVTGYDASSFGPDDDITREQLAAILWRYAKYKGYDVSVGEDTNILSYDDAIGGMSEWAVSALQWACGAGIINGIGTKLEARGSATRAQAACMIQRFCENVAK